MTYSRLMKLRWLVVVALVGLLPPMVAGSICVSADGRGVEMGGCACITLPAPTGAAFANPAPSACGPCTDEAFTALRGGHVPATQAPALSVAHSLPIPTAAAGSGWANSTPAARSRSPERNQVLRC